MKKLFYTLVWICLLSHSSLFPSYLSNKAIDSQANNAVRYFTSRQKFINFQLLTRSFAEKVARSMIEQDTLRIELLSLGEKNQLIRLFLVSKEIMNFYDVIITSKGNPTQDQIASVEVYLQIFEQLWQGETLREAANKISKAFNSHYSVTFNTLTDDETRLYWVFASDIMSDPLSAFTIFIKAHLGDSEVMKDFEKIAFSKISKLIKLRYWRIKSFFDKERPFFVFKEIYVAAIDSLIEVLEKNKALSHLPSSD